MAYVNLMISFISSDVVGNDEYWGWSRGLSGGRGGESVHDPEGAVGSGCSRTVAGVHLPFLHEMRVLLWKKRAICSVTILTLLLSNKTLLTIDVCPDCVKSIWDLYI